jgi:alkyl sulfatase BDS1-like metallo-beta-lactamase superfamily hydrolase
MALRLRRFLNELLDLLREDYPEQLDGIIRDAKGLTCFQMLDRETAIIKVRDKTIRVSGKVKKDEINLRVYMSRDCLFNVLEGKQTLEEAINAGELKVFGDPVVLLSCYKVWERVISLARTSPRFYFLTYKLR